MDELDLSIVIVSFNDKGVLMPCLESIYKSEPKIQYEVIVVDNVSRDGTPDIVRTDFPQVNLIDAGYNAGYTGGNNIGFEAARGRYVLFLNPDTLIHPGALDEMVRTADDHPECGALGPKVLNPDGTLQPTLYRAPTVLQMIYEALLLHRIPGVVRFFGQAGFYKHEGFKEVRPVDVVCGCCIMGRKSLLDVIGPFDNDFFIYFEETDLCERVRRSGHPVLYTPHAEITHLGGTTVSRQHNWFRIQYEQSKRRFFRKYRSRFSLGCLYVIFFLDSLVRLLLGVGGMALTVGRSASIRKKMGTAWAKLGWQLGLMPHGPRPTS